MRALYSHRMVQVKQIKAHKFSDKFIELLSNKKKSLDINEYDYCVAEWAKVHESKMIRYYIYTAILFLSGMWAVYEQSWFIAVLLLALAANYNRQSSHHILMSEIMNHQRLLAMLINKRIMSDYSEDQDNETSIGLGSFLFNSPLNEANDLLIFLKNWHIITFKDKPVTEGTIGEMYIQFLNFSKEGVVDNPDLEKVVEEFDELRNAYLISSESQ